MDEKVPVIKFFNTKRSLEALLVIFSLLVISFILQGADILPFNIFPLIAFLGLLFLTLGGYLIFLAQKESGRLKHLLMITGISAIAPFLGSILHNLFYALAISFPSLSILFESLHVVFFLIALLVAPLVFIICTIYSLILLHQAK